MLTQIRLGEGPIASLIRLRVLDGNTHPR
jgi:hypothetical protein